MMYDPIKIQMMLLWSMVCLAVVVCLAPRSAWLSKPKIDRMTHAELLAYSARLDHELWPGEANWNHPASCSACRPHSGLVTAGVAAHQVMTGHEPDWRTIYVECRQLGSPEPYLIPGPRECRRCEEMRHLAQANDNRVT